MHLKQSRLSYGLSQYLLSNVNFQCINYPGKIFAGGIMRIIKRIFTLSLFSLLSVFVLYPALWIVASTGILGDIEFGYNRDVNLVKNAIEAGHDIESLEFGIHDDFGVEDFRAFIHTKSRWKITFAFWEEMDIRQVCENPKGIIISMPDKTNQIHTLESLSEALKDKHIQLRNIRDVIRHFDDVMPIFEANLKTTLVPEVNHHSDPEASQYLNITWDYPWNTKPIEEARERLIAQIMERQKQPARELQNDEFETVTLDSKGVVTERSKKQTKSYYEKLEDRVILEMVEIPAGKFLMGISGTEADKIVADEIRTNINASTGWVYERLAQQMPQHSVTISKFYMGKFEITQGQWYAVATKLPKINRELIPYPSDRKGEDLPTFRKDDYLPVENVSWEDAIEFCNRLSRLTGKEYRLPSEAEWEYACRGTTTTLFNTGQTITSDYANIYGSYGGAVWSLDRNEPIPVGVLGIANGFGLYDMHGNMSELCLDTWHDNYKGAPANGNAWTEEGKNDVHILRGGGWSSVLMFSMVAWREQSWEKRDSFYDTGFRVVTRD
jgi:formylglycine-generating enzyme required for sulfatase activity